MTDMTNKQPTGKHYKAAAKGKKVGVIGIPAATRLVEIALIIEGVDQRCMAADGPVSATLSEMSQAEISRIYALASAPVAMQDEDDSALLPTDVFDALRAALDALDRLLPDDDGNMTKGDTMSIPRRINVDRWTPAEKAISHAIGVVEEMGADERLTRAVVLLGEAGHAVADFVDGVPTSPSPD